MDSHIYLCQKINHKQMQSIIIAKGDGIGPEIMDATLKIIKAAGTQLEFDEIEVGEKVGKKEHSWNRFRKQFNKRDYSEHAPLRNTKN
jgi:isocitrate/isopropylmalate dehydrogenase